MIYLHMLDHALPRGWRHKLPERYDRFKAERVRGIVKGLDHRGWTLLRTESPRQNFRGYRFRHPSQRFPSHPPRSWQMRGWWWRTEWKLAGCAE